MRSERGNNRIWTAKRIDYEKVKRIIEYPSLLVLLHTAHVPNTCNS